MVRPGLWRPILYNRAQNSQKFRGQQRFPMAEGSTEVPGRVVSVDLHFCKDKTDALMAQVEPLTRLEQLSGPFQK
jgi:hypothetical protein